MKTFSFKNISNLNIFVILVVRRKRGRMVWLILLLRAKYSFKNILITRKITERAGPEARLTLQGPVLAEWELSWQRPQRWVLRPCSAVIAEGARRQTQLALRLLRPAMWGVWEQVLQMVSRADGAARRWQRRGEGHCLLKAWPRPVEAAVRALEGQQDTAPNMSPGPPDHCWSVAGWTGAPWGEGRDWLLPHFPRDNPCSADLAWLSPLTVTHWQLLPWGEEPIENGWTGLAAW